jgi:hypothetical protein
MVPSPKQCIHLALLLCGSLALTAEVDLDAEFFPKLDQHSDETIRLHGLASLYPGTVLFETPELATRSQRVEAAKIEDLPNNIAYVRIYRLDEAISAIRDTIKRPALILDLRYLQSESAGIELANLLNSQSNVDSLTAVGQLPSSIQSAIDEIAVKAANRKYPAIVLCNRETAGPFEAILQILQKNGCIIGVGEATAGRTGFYKTEDEQTWIIEGELRPSPHESLINQGFIPRIQMQATPESNYVSYHIYEAGTPISRLLRGNKPIMPESDEPSESAPDKFEPDAVLQRGVDIVAALQVLQQLPNNN